MEMDPLMSGHHLRPPVRRLSSLLLAGLCAFTAEAHEPDAERILPGRWISDLDGLVLLVEPSGRFEVMPPDRPTLEGRWWVDDGLVHFRNADGVPVCSGVTGRYRLRVLPDGITFEAVGGDCPPRAMHLESMLSPDEP